MELVYRKSRSTVMPELVDTTSSKTTVYLRKNINEVTEKDPMTEEEITVFEYDEAKLTKSEYALYLSSMSSEEADTAAQLAIAELAEQMEANKVEMEQALAELAEATIS